MIDDLIRDLRLLLKADALIGKIWVRSMVRQFGLFAFAGLIAVFGLAMADVAGFYALRTSLGPIWAAALMAIGDFVLAAIVMLMGRSCQREPEIDLAFDVRKIAIESIQADARDPRGTIDALGQEIQKAKDSIVGFVQNPLDAAVQKLLIPAATSVIRALRSRKDQATQA
jgi:hypothetical protein